MNKKIVLPIVLFIIIGASLGSYLLISPLSSQDLFLITPLFLVDGDYEELERINFTVCGVTIDDFAYWLQDIDKDRVKDSKYDLIIIDYSSDGSETGEYSSTDVTYMKSSGDKEKLLISYISIGEAENYRFYWNTSWDANEDGIPDDGAPEWLDIENPEWEGNYKVHYWDPDWQNIINQYLDRIIAAGFDGIYMDIIDAYEYYEENVTHADWLMIDFVGNIADYVNKSAGSNFAVFVQNGDPLLLNSTYLSYIDGIGREDLFYYGNEATDDDWRNEGINNLNAALAENKAVLVTDYPTRKSKIYDSYTNCITNGFLPYGAVRDLDTLKEYAFYPAT